MHKTLVIHNDNICDKNIFDRTKKFENTSKNLDIYISNFIEDIKVIEFDILYIKDTLSENYLEFYGLLLAHHIRLSETLGDKRYIPIVILSELDVYTINKLTLLGKIFFTKNIFISTNKKTSIKYFNEKLKSKPTIKNTFEQDFLDMVQIKPSENTSNHDIANQWAIYRWSEFVSVKRSEAITKNNKKIDSLLYFKYLKAKHPLPKKQGTREDPKKPNKSGKILYIDDEWEKGWRDIFVEYFDESEFITVEEDYEKKSTNEILKFCEKAIKVNMPDIVLLDMRLHKDDHEDDIQISQLTGMRVLKLIKEINKGIQVILITASGKSNTLEEAINLGILGYIKKDHPQDHEKIEDKFRKLADLTNKGFEKKYLKEIWKIRKSINSNLENIKLKDFDIIESENSYVFGILDSNIEKNIIFGMLTIYKCLESLKEIYSKNDKFNRFFYKGINHGIVDMKEFKDLIRSDFTSDKDWEDRKKTYTTTENKLHAILYQKLEIDDIDDHRSITKITRYRNSNIHPDKDASKLSPNSDDIKVWYKMLDDIIKKYYDNN